MFKRSIYDFTKTYLDTLGDLTGKTVVDVPAGLGDMSSEFTRRGAKVIALDLYPEKIKGDVDEKLFVDMNSRFPLKDEVADIVLCQEGIEHVPNQLNLMEELNRVLKPGGKLLITTPSLSHLRARLSMLIVESEYWKRLPASEVDSVWFSDSQNDHIYFGHFFLLTANQLRLLAVLTGFSVNERRRTSLSWTSVLLFLIFYPFVAFSSAIACLDSYRKNRQKWNRNKRGVYLQQVLINVSPVTLLCKDFFWVLEKTRSVAECREQLKLNTR